MNPFRSFQKNKKSAPLLFSLLLITHLIGCSTLPPSQFKRYTFPKGLAFYGNIDRPYTTLGTVRSKVDFPSLDDDHDEKELCKNYFNKAVRELVKTAKKKGGDAVIDIKSVVYMEDGKSEIYPKPECSDDGLEGQILTQGIVIKWKPEVPENIQNPPPPRTVKNPTDPVL